MAEPIYKVIIVGAGPGDSVRRGRRQINWSISSSTRVS